MKTIVTWTVFLLFLTSLAVLTYNFIVKCDKIGFAKIQSCVCNGYEITDPFPDATSGMADGLNSTVCIGLQQIE